ncbi:MAG TPA: DUF4188 domain-containing protein [Polyangiaceae bacterium]|jgi:hypothetical protein|nr:DUF4188 domain-containing protein [Polyangiaceae bacterium]
MDQVIPERMTAVRDDDIVVFLIGMRINRWWKIHRWLPVVLAMPRMLRELAARPDAGMLGSHSAGFFMVQYWESAHKLLAYASDRSGAHFPAWAEFYRRVGKSGDVGIWHETYVVPRGRYESIYANMPPFGLGKFARLEPASGRKARAIDRLESQTST